MVYLGGNDLIVRREVYRRTLVGCPCVATVYDNIHVNYPSKKFQDFLLIVFALCIIYFF
jgi:hypothetical protein